MSDNINFNQVTKKHSFFTVKEPAWHNLGKILENAPTSAEAIIHAGLDYTVAKTPVLADIANEDDRLIPFPVKVFPNRYITYRTDTNDLFGIVSDRYEVIQNREAFGFFDAIVGDGQAIYETAGALGRGETIFITAKLPDHIKVLEKDVINKYLLLTMSHDGTKAITAMFTPIRVVCANTLSMALDGASNKVFVRHTSNAKYNLEQAHIVLGITKRLSESMEGTLSQFAKTTITDAHALDLIRECVLTNTELTSDEDELSAVKKNLVDAINEYYHIGIGQAEYLGTLYGLYNAISGYYQNVRDYNTDSSKFNFIFMGEGQRISQLMFNKCLLYYHGDRTSTV